MNGTSMLRSLPKVLLHEHLDGSVRPATLFDLLQARGIEPPAPDVASLAAWFDARAHAGSLVEYLRGFALTVAAMASVDAMERVAYEAVLDAHASGCVLAELRIAPILFEPHGVAMDDAIAALIAGLARGADETGTACGLIVCGMRQQSTADVLRSADAAIAHRAVGTDRGVIGFDLAGPEQGFPATLHRDALRRVREAGLAITLHAGEADAAERVVEAADVGATRIGHGVRLAEALDDPNRRRLVDDVRARDLHLEVCPTSNVHTGAAASIATHPIRALFDAGVSLSFHTDNALMSGVSMVDEARSLIDEARFSIAELVRMELEAARHSFLPDDDRRRAREAIVAWAAAHGIDAERTR